MGSGDSGPTPNYMVQKKVVSTPEDSMGRRSSTSLDDDGSYTGKNGLKYRKDGTRVEIRNGKELVLVDPDNQSANDRTMNQKMDGASTSSAKKVAARGGTAIDESLRQAQIKLDKEIADQKFKVEDQLNQAQNQTEIAKQKKLRLKSAKETLYGPVGQSYSNPNNTKTILGA